MGSNSRDFYSRLEVDRGASRDDIVGAYRRLAMGAHPDAHPEDPTAAARFREITEAYEVLGDPKRRDAYDRQLAGTRIEVRVHHVSRGDDTGDDIGDDIGVGEGAWHHHEGEPVFLSTSRSRRRDVPLGVWPVRHDPVGGEAHDTAPPVDRWTQEVSDLLGRIVESWWGI